jgi:hydrogenase nickel incorporation protein HypA/HybF
VHERALMANLIRKVEDIGTANGAVRVTRVVVRLGALSHFTVDHFREHFVEAARGTVAEGAHVEARLDDDLAAVHAADVVLESVDVEAREGEEARR